MSPASCYRPPRGWLRVGKYLLPIGVKTSSWLPTAAPRAQVPIAQLALEHPESVGVQYVGDAQHASVFNFVCHRAGKRELRSLPAELFPPAYVAQLSNCLLYTSPSPRDTR